MMRRVTPGTVRDLRTASLLRILRAVHDAPAPPTRAAMTRQLGLGRGSATVLVAALKERRLLAESPAFAGVAPARPGRGRPTAQLVPHPAGPVVLAVSITHDGWTLDTVELGAGVLDSVEGGHDSRRSPRVLDAIVDSAGAAVARLGGRAGALALSVPGTIQHGRIAQASLLGWTDLPALAPFARLDLPMTLVNDATAAGIGEVRRGAGRDHGVVLHLHADAGIGGALFIDGVPVRDAQGAGGEFGHMPLAVALSGRPRRCHCGAYGCWDLDVGNLALAEPSERPDLRSAQIDQAGGAPDTAPRPSVRRAAGRVLDRARSGERAALDRVTAVASALGRGIGALVNGYDPELVTLSGAAATIADLAGDALRDGYRDGLMGFRRAAPPPVRIGDLAGRGQRAGTAELAFDLLLTERLLGTGREASPAHSQ